MASSEIFKNLFARYKRFEKLFLRVDKNGGQEKAEYINLKYQFRIKFTFSLLTTLVSISLLLLHGQFLPLPYPLLASVLVGFRYKWYNVPRVMLLIAMTMIPVYDLVSDQALAAPSAIMFTNILMLVLTQSQLFTLAHLVIQTLIMYFYGVDMLVQKIQNLTPDEIAKLVQAAAYLCLMGTWVGLIMMQRFYSHVNNLLRKINALRNNLSLANNQLNTQNVKLQSNLEMKDVFIYTFSHELKNALNGLLGNLTLAYDSAAKNPQLARLILPAKVCGEVLKNFVHNILDSGKLENGNLEVSPEKRDVMSFMENIWAVCGRIIENKRLHGCLEIEKNVPRYLDLDEQRMIQIVLNLISNACKFTEKGYVRIHISWQPISTSDEQHIPQEDESCEIRNSNSMKMLVQNNKDTEEYGDVREFKESSEDCLLNKEKLHLVTEGPKKFITDSQSYHLTLSKWNWHREEVLPSGHVKGAKGILKVQVLDTGCGMSSEDQAKLFQRCCQTNRTTGQRKVGTGLGLWICKELAKGLDGDIKMRSVVGVGSTFELTIRTTISRVLKKQHSFTNFSQYSDNSPTRSIQKRKKQNKRKILIADDDNFNVELMKNFLDKFAIEYFCAYDGEEAVSVFKKHYEEICFVITDNYMPKKMGAEAAFEIASFLEEMKQSKIPIICISGDVKVDVGEKGITKVIQKPINFDRLKEELAPIYPQVDASFAA